MWDSNPCFDLFFQSNGDFRKLHYRARARLRGLFFGPLRCSDEVENFVSRFPELFIFPLFEGKVCFAF